VGQGALRVNVDGIFNVAVGGAALVNNVNGSFNTAIGTQAGFSITGTNNIDIGQGVFGLATDNFVTRIGIGVSSTPVLNPAVPACFIDGILQNFVGGFIGQTIVAIDPVTGQLLATNNTAANKVAEQQKKIEEQQASISQLKSEMQTIVAQLKEQATQIQKVSAQLEVSKRAPQTVLND
jgi:hypothetical protein